MKSPSYREQDYAFGQRILTLRTRIGLTQTGLAEYLGISRRAVADWEAGSKYPKAKHLQALIALGIEHKAFEAGQEAEAEAIRALWKSARQKVLLDEQWLAGLVGASAGIQEKVAGTRVGDARVDWGGASSVQAFYGREWERDLLASWIIGERCRVVTILGMGGIGKSTLAVKFMRQNAASFEFVIWRSLRDLPSCDALLEALLQALAPTATDFPIIHDERMSLLLRYLRERRILLVLDNMESLLEEGENAGHLRPGYEGYLYFLQQAATTEHQSCVLLTSREKLNDLAPLEGNQSPVRSLRLNRLDVQACETLLSEKSVTGTAAERAQLIDSYTGNPLALKIVAQTVADLFDGEIAPFLEQGEVIFGGVRALLAEQFGRLSALEQNVLLWLAVLREPTSFDVLLAMQVRPSTRGKLMEAVEALYRRSLIERGQQRGSFTLQSVVLEYLTTRLIDDISDELVEGRLDRLVHQGLELAGSPENVRQTQERLILKPILALLSASFHEPASVEALLRDHLDMLRDVVETLQGYAPANLVNLLRLLRGNLRGMNLSNLVLREVPLQAVEMQDAALNGALLRDCTFTENFDGLTSLGISVTGEIWAATSYVGDSRVWRYDGRLLRQIWRDTNDITMRVAISPDGQTLLSALMNGTCRLRDVTSGGTILTTSADDGLGRIVQVAFSTSGDQFAGAGGDGYVRVWDSASGMLLHSLFHAPYAPTLCWHPDGTLIATGGVNGVIRLWRLDQAKAAVIQTIEAHTQVILTITFSPDGSQFISGSTDGTSAIWNTADGSLEHTLPAHSDWLFRTAWSADGSSIAVSGRDGMLRIWDVAERRYRLGLHGFTTAIRGLHFLPGNRTLVSGGDDGTLRTWDTVTGECTQIMHGYTTTIQAVEWSPDGRQIASGGTKGLIVLFDVDGSAAPRILRGHTSSVQQLAWSPDGRLLASGAFDNLIRLWDPATGAVLTPIEGDSEAVGLFDEITWSPDSRFIVTGTANYGILLFDLATRTARRFGKESADNMAGVIWSPDGTMLAATADNNSIYIWDVVTERLLHRLVENQGLVWWMVWSPDSTRLATVGSDSKGPSLLIWDVERGTCMRLAPAYPHEFNSVAWATSDAVITIDKLGDLCWWDSHTGERIRAVQSGMNSSLHTSPDCTMVALAGDDGGIALYDAQSGVLIRTLRTDRPYERMAISGIRGLNDAQIANLKALGANTGLSAED